MKIENSFSVEAPFDQVWAHLTDIPTLASCLAGVVMNEEVDGVYAGSVKSKVGPVTAEYRSSARFVERNKADGRIVLDANGRDSRTEGNVRMLVTAHVVNEGDTTAVAMSTDISGTGKVAQLSRGVLQTVSEKLLARFVSCLAIKLEEAEVVGEQPATNLTSRQTAESGDADALDLLDAAGGAVAKRVLPVAVALLVVVALLLYLL